MANIVIMPQIGITVTECMLTAWHKNLGDTVTKGDILFSYETDKTSIDEISEFSGVLLDRFYEEGDVVKVLEKVCVIGEAGEKYEKETKAEAPAVKTAPATSSDKAPAAAPAAAEKQAPVSGAPVSPRAKTFARRLGVDDLSGIAPSGPEGRVIARDVEKAAASLPVKAAAPASAVFAPASPAAAYTDRKQSNVRRVIAKAMGASLRDIPQLTLNSSFDATAILALRKRFKDMEEFSGITINDMIVHTVAKVLPSFPELNAHLLDDTLRLFSSVNVGIAVDTDRGLLVPAVAGADKNSLLATSKAIKDLVAAAKTGAINPDLLSIGTFTISNLGSLGIESFTPVINPPQTGILGVDGITYRLRADGTTYPAMGLSLTFDHRAIDGAPAARFVQAVSAYLENFDLMQMK